jgi:MATE family multidrug resistance protein
VLTPPPVTRRAILGLAWPIVLANAAVPLLGLVDTAVIGNTGSVAGLGAIALGALVFNFAYWSFGFLRMGTTGFTAQASGAGDTAEVRATLGRALLLGAGIGVTLVVLQRPIVWAALALLGATPEVESLTREYFDLRIWGAPASLCTFGILGSFVGLGRTRHLLVTQLVLNGVNIILDVVFAVGFGWGVKGIALGTAIAEWVTLGIALVLALRVLRAERLDDEPFWPAARIADRALALRTLGANGDIMVRTLFLLMGFAWFTNQGALFGADVLAANHVLLQLVSLSAYLLDGYAHATEIHVGRAVGARARTGFDQAVRAATQLAAATAALLGVSILLAGPSAIGLLTDLGPVRAVAERHLPHSAIYVVVSFAAFQLDGIFIGATGTREMRNASVISFTAFVGLSHLLTPAYENLGLWWAFIFYVVVRAATLGARYPRLRRGVGRPVHAD